METPEQAIKMGKGTRVMAAGYLAVVGLSLFEVGLWNLRTRNAWALGDWLINYEGGFVRRGLVGEAVYLAGAAFGVTPAALVVGLQLGLYGVLLTAVWRLMRGTRDSFWGLALLFSPATLAFPLLDCIAGFRKEEIYLAGLAWLLVRLRDRQERGLQIYLGGFLAVLALSHEAMVCFAPYVVGGVAIGLGSVRRAVRVSAPGLLIGAVCWGLAVTHAGTTGLVERICGSLGPASQGGLTGAGLCGGAIASLGEDPSIARVQVQMMMHFYHPAWLYIRLTALAMLPVLLGAARMWREGRARRGVQVVAAASAVAWACSGMLFVYALDWGRWISIHVFSVFLLLVFLEQMTGAQNKPAWEFATRTRRAWSVTLLLAYATTWTLPHIPSVSLRAGYFSLFGRAGSTAGFAAAGTAGESRPEPSE